MITISQAFDILRNNLPEPDHEVVNLNNGFCRCLAQDILAPEPSPRYTNSAMDGYAVRWEDVKASSPDHPTLLRIAGESQAGVPYEKTVQSGEAVRISTGAAVPEGADTVVRMEDTGEQSGSVAILTVKKQGQDIRRRGEEFQEGDRLLNAGDRLKTRQLAMLASVGIHEVKVFRRPHVSLLITGTELVTSDNEAIKPFQIRDSNKVMLGAAVEEAGGKLSGCVHVGDDLDATIAELESAASRQPDFILCSGGVSVGRHDHVKKAAEISGFSELFWRIFQKPGKPLFAARRANTLLFGLPGNPVSAFMCFSHYVRPILAYLQGQPLAHESVTAGIGEEVLNKGGRTNFLRVRVEFGAGKIPRIAQAQKQGSHMLSSITQADGYIIMEPGERLCEGDLKEVYLF